MELVTIGEFARAARLSPKALRLYDELGLLTPARVDPASGYRLYSPDQLGRARLVAWLRRLGMPLARIRLVCELAPREAAAEVRAHWARVEADTAARRDLAAFLVEQLSGEDTTVTVTLRCALRTDRGLVRDSNQDRGYAGERLLAVADGFGARGEPLSSVAIESLAALDTAIPAGELLNTLADAVHRAGAAVGDYLSANPAGSCSGTTLTALVLSGSRLGLVHVGDARVYLRRGDGLFRITHDHTVVQSLIAEGRLTEEEALSHPQRSMLVRALHGGRVEPDLALHDALPGDRYLLCSDGLHTVVPQDDLGLVLRRAADPDEAVRRLVDLANANGGPDNVVCVVADVVAAG
ncbi:MerR family transcriptional regulator [Saccharothrix algeriensis]|uniref:MerR family transcriptional regulator n=1 Tax=Saccharothrix algeriensis TaxID=173560 RepID=A0A8T8HYL0_9PSEU|nr:MerR family transcriptional regulator [Saccharothrix algeriensis]MBM7809285.1 protein phosphatase [Saccharothrix algeriensis]QTR03632.1 MerR family transcriptional regulator [Saccharothrix algeriensis]